MARAPRLLAVDDHAASAELIARVAERCGYEAFATSDSRGVITLVAALKPEVMAVDIAMPHVDAVELFGLLAAQHYQGQIIIVSGQDAATLAVVQHAGEAMGLRRPHLHPKPLDIARLRETLNGAAIAKALR